MSESQTSLTIRPTASRDDRGPARQRAVLVVGLGAQIDRHVRPADGLRRRMDDLTAMLPAGWWVLHAEYRGQPCIAGALAVFQEAGVDELIVVPQYPHFSRQTTGLILSELYRVLARNAGPMAVAVRSSWHDDPAYVNAQASVVREYVSTHGLDPADTHLWFWAHAACRDAAGPSDPYESCVRRAAELVTERLGWPRDRTSLTFADAESAVERPGDGHLLVCPLTFPMDRGSVLARLGRSQGDAAPGANGQRVHVCPTLDHHEALVPALRDIVLRGTRPMPSPQATAEPLLTARPSQRGADRAGTLVMIGAAVQGRLTPQRGPTLHYSDPEVFTRIKQPRKALRELLQWAAQRTPVAEAFVWNTCQRVEFYGWLRDGQDVAERECQVGRIRHRLFGTEPDGLRVNVLFGQQAWRHLARTACGLNSRLPGDRDIVEQLHAAGRVARCAGVAGPHVTRAIERAVSLARAVRRETGWGEVSVGYCTAAVAQVFGRLGADPGPLRHVVIGGSTTSRSILSTLAQRFAVPQDQLTIAYRDHHGQLKRIRSAIGHGRRLRVHTYADRRVLDAIRDADVLYFGIDHAEPVLDPSVLHGVRDFDARPLTILDFNSFGSLGDGGLPHGVTVWAARALDDAVEAYADALCDRDDCSSAAAEAEDWIARHATTFARELPCTAAGP